MLVIALAGSLFTFTPKIVSADELIVGKEIIRRMDTLMRGDTMTGVYEMTIRDPNWERALRLSAWENRKEKKAGMHSLYMVSGPV